MSDTGDFDRIESQIIDGYNSRSDEVTETSVETSVELDENMDFSDSEGMEGGRRLDSDLKSHEAWTLLNSLMCTHSKHQQRSKKRKYIEEDKKMLYQWPVHPRNLLRVNFDQEPTDICLNEQPSLRSSEKNARASYSGLGKLPEPLCEYAESQFGSRLQHVNSSKNDVEALCSIVRRADLFVDQLLQVILVQNALVLQGKKTPTSRACWSNIDERPCANSNFIKEIVLDFNRKSQMVNKGVGFLPLNDQTMERIALRINKLFAD